ncbi:MAG: DUF4384 domain-containing protein [Treponema sp.]|jgi:hypothetical protein|nr:DUF4384 domain-containing protein [Treponema sp.]
MKKLFVFMCIGCLCVTLLSAQELESGVRNAVNRLAERLLQPLEVSIGAMTLEGTDMTSEFSHYLYQLVYLYVDNNLSFKIVNVTRRAKRPDEPQRGIIKGSFAQRRDTVEVFLFMVSDTDGSSFGSQRFTFPLAELTSREISIEPENRTIVEEQQRIFAELSGTENSNVPPVSISPANQSIQIQAFFNSQSMTYMHRDELKLTVIADRDCYFKIIHIDVNNQIKMIYPTKNDNNNFLRANVSRTVFDNPNSRYVLYGPYGAETLIVVASPVQFSNIDREYNEPWKAASEETIRAAISGVGQARYPIIILKPHEEYEYAKPENMTELYQAIRDDVVQQGGYFEGNTDSGFYIINNIRGSYRVPRDKPDTIQFATYFLDTYTANSYSSIRTRGSPFNFSFARPQNISQALQTVRSSIMEKGGTFNGNEQQGDFRSSGITGKYQVSDVVDVTISEKPFVIPNSLIENEVKNYFGVR